MNLDAKIAQLFIVECPTENPSSFVKSYQPAGILLDADQFGEGATVGSVANLTSGMQMEAMVPMFIVVQEEGGSITPISSNNDFRTWPFQSPQQLIREGGLSYVENDTAEKSRLLKSMNINVNMAPNANVSVSDSDYMYDRTLGQPATDVAQYVTYVVSQMGKNSMGSVMMHFPGYGNNPDNSFGPVVDNRTLAQLQESDLIPFAAGIAEGADAILMTHNKVTALDSELPASLSLAAHTYLRETMGFDGVIMTDALDAPAVASSFDSAAAAVKAVQAGNDLIIVNEAEYIDQYVAIQNAISGGHIDVAMLDQAVLRVLDWKDELGLLQQAISAPVTPETEDAQAGTTTPATEPEPEPMLPKPENPRKDNATEATEK